MHCIITGFDPFGGAKTNPSQLAVEALPQFVADDRNTVSIAKTILTTCCEEAWMLLQKEVASVPAESRFLLVMAGVAAARSSISLERFALNTRQYRTHDNRGHQWEEEYIEKSGPDALRTTVELQRLARLLSEKGHEVEISNHAGTFVCNETYYRALYKWQPDPRCAGILFVHLPAPELYAQTLKLPADDSVIERYTRALQDIVLNINGP